MASIALNVSTFPVNSTVLVTMTGSSTTFVQGTTLITSTMSGLSFTVPVVTSTTAATFYVTANSVIGSGTVTEATSSSTANVATETVAAYILAGNSPLSVQNDLQQSGTYLGSNVFDEVYKASTGVNQTKGSVQTLNAN